MSAVPAHIRLSQMLSGYWLSMSLHVAARLELADRLARAAQTAEELAHQTGTHAPALYRLLRALASVGVFAEDEHGRFSLTELAQGLRREVPGSQWGLAMMLGGEQYRAWGELLHCIRTGETGFERVFGKPLFDYMSDRPELAAIFDEAMVGVHGQESAAMCDAYDFSGFTTLVDVGGGNGSLLSVVLARTPGLRAILYDLPHVVARARSHLHALGIAERCALQGGNFFDSVPAGGDAYLVRHILHDWDDARCLTILGNIRKVIPTTGKLLVVEGVIPAGNAPSFTKLLDLTMLVIPGGKERTQAEYAELYRRAGFRLSRLVPTQSEVSILEGIPA